MELYNINTYGGFVMDEKIKDFLEKYDAMVAAANKIEEFKYKLEIEISSDNQYREVRENVISEINNIFVKNGMKYRSTSGN